MTSGTCFQFNESFTPRSQRYGLWRTWVSLRIVGASSSQGGCSTKALFSSAPTPSATLTFLPSLATSGSLWVPKEMFLGVSVESKFAWNSGASLGPWWHSLRGWRWSESPPVGKFWMRHKLSWCERSGWVSLSWILWEIICPDTEETVSNLDDWCDGAFFPLVKEAVANWASELCSDCTFLLCSPRTCCVASADFGCLFLPSPSESERAALSRPRFSVTDAEFSWPISTFPQSLSSVSTSGTSDSSAFKRKTFTVVNNSSEHHNAPFDCRVSDSAAFSDTLNFLPSRFRTNKSPFSRKPLSPACKQNKEFDNLFAFVNCWHKLAISCF